MSLTILRSHGVYDSDSPPVEYANAYFEGFQNCEFISGSVAAPRLPSALPRASGTMLSVVTPVLTGLNSLSLMSFFAYANPAQSVSPQAAVSVFSFIYMTVNSTSFDFDLRPIADGWCAHALYTPCVSSVVSIVTEVPLTCCVDTRLPLMSAM